MKPLKYTFFFLFLFVQCSTVRIPQTVSFDGQALNRSFRRIQSGDAGYTEACRQLLLDADKCLTEGPYTVTSKPKMPPSGDKHDYISMGPYWWPNPDTPDGLPYIRKDGFRNPERNLYEDRSNLGKLMSAVETLGLAYYFSKNEKYAEHAALLLKVWFLDKETLMNPHLNYGQSVPGITDGRAEGLIETTGFIAMLDGVRLLEGSKSWTHQDNEALKKWFADFFDWMQTSKIGADERNAKNNHGTWYDAQSVAMALYIGKTGEAKQIVSGQTVARLRSQIMPDGSQPRELARADSWNYSNMNLRGFFTVATLARHVDVNLWTVTNDDGKPYLQTALDFLIPAFEDSTLWKYSQVSNRFDRGTMLNLLQRASVVYDNPDYALQAKKYQSSEKKDAENRNMLIGYGE
ncbi:MAG: alginate lyase family protein [Tannerella sp.]|jgi:hypothetical protein|nr:alginate lyase family protein [Tannerella sp.]